MSHLLRLEATTGLNQTSHGDPWDCNWVWQAVAGLLNVKHLDFSEKFILDPQMYLRGKENVDWLFEC